MSEPEDAPKPTMESSAGHEPAGHHTVTQDGSPVALYLALPAGDIPRLIHEASAVEGSVLELGCGAGRITRPLIALGHTVVAVDDSAAMLDHVTGAETVQADCFELDLDRTFDTVIAGSYFINTPDRDRRRTLLRTCRKHVGGSGVVLVQRHDPAWLANPMDSDGTSGPVDIAFRVLDHRNGELHARITYKIGPRSWAQTFTAAPVTDQGLDEDAAACGLVVDRWLDTSRSWALLRPTPPEH